MVSANISSDLIQRLAELAAQENRSPDSLLTTMLRLYGHQATEAEIDRFLAQETGITAPTNAPLELPLTETEDQRLADYLGGLGQPMSEVIVAERRQGY